jgi:hypothetical protein
LQQGCRRDVGADAGSRDNQSMNGLIGVECRNYCRGPVPRS